MNILTFDVEEWFHLLDNDSARSEEQWKRYEVRIYGNVERILRILDETGLRHRMGCPQIPGLGAPYCGQIPDRQPHDEPPVGVATKP